MRPSVGTIAVWAVAALAGCILMGCGSQDPAPSPVGVWEVADPEAWARDELPRLRSINYTGEPNTWPQVRIGADMLPRDPRGRSDGALSADLVRVGRAQLLEFKADGTFANNFQLWLPGTWTANEGRVQTVQPWPEPPRETPPSSEPLIPPPPPVRIEFRFDGPDLICFQAPSESHPVRMRRSSRSFAPPAEPEPATPDAAPR